MNNVAKLAAAVVLACVSGVQADAFGTGANQFDIDFVLISGDAGDLGSWPAGSGYTFTGTQGTGDYTLDTWSPAEADNGTNLYRHKDAMYYMPTEDEWVKAGYWNGTSLQTYATKPGDTLHQGDGVSGAGWN